MGFSTLPLSTTKLFSSKNGLSTNSTLLLITSFTLPSYPKDGILIICSSIADLNESPPTFSNLYNVPALQEVKSVPFGGFSANPRIEPLWVIVGTVCCKTVDSTSSIVI